MLNPSLLHIEVFWLMHSCTLRAPTHSAPALPSPQVVFFYNALNVLYSVLDEDLCTPRRCPVMSAGPQVRRRAGMRVCVC